jgi:hypothetical protein
MKSVMIDFDCNIRKWIVCEANGLFTDIIETFDWMNDAIAFCEENGFGWR